MNEETTLRDYFDVLIRRWKWVLAMPILAMLAAALVSLAMPPTYEATAILALAPATLSIPTANQVPPYYLLVDSPRQLPTAYTPAYYVAILKSAQVVDTVAPRVPVTIAPNGSDKSLLEITARGDDPQKVAATANTWAQVGAERIQQILLPNEDAAATAQKKLDAADQALARFARDNALGAYDVEQLRLGVSLSGEKKAELERLLRARDLAESIYLDFARELERAKILATTLYKPTTIAAPVPAAPVSPKPLQNVLVGAAFGLLLGILGAFAVERIR